MSTPYAELECTTNFSFLRGASHPDELVERAVELGCHALAVTDLNTLAGVVRAHVAAKESGLKLIIAARIETHDAPPLLIYPTDRAAYGRLSSLITVGRRRAEKGSCTLYLSDVLEHAAGQIIAVTPVPESESTFATTVHNLREACSDRLYISARCGYGADDHGRLDMLRDLSARFAVPLVAVNDVHYHIPERRMLQDVLTAVREGVPVSRAGRRLFSNGERYLKPPDEIARLFRRLPDAIARTVEIADRCRFNLDELRYEYPAELAPDGTTPIQYLRHLTETGVRQRYPDGLPDKVRRLIEHELALIEELHYEAYFLTVHDIVRFARSRNILCQGRGSAANSAVCYCIGVTAVDPARVDLLFERFVSRERDEPPDIDIDFEHERREEVIQYIYQRFGRDRTGMTGVVTTYRGRSAVRDVGKALSLSLDAVDKLAKACDRWDEDPLADERLIELGFNPADATMRHVVALTRELVGFPRHLSQHVGGFVMTRGLLHELVPIENAAMADRTVIEWNKDDIDALGILKVDVLGLGMLTCIRKAIEFVNRRRRVPLELHTIPAEDPVVYDMICRADTIGVFQIESRAQMSMLPRLRPRTYYDLVIEVAIVRPGPIQGNMVHPYLRRRRGEEPVTYPNDAVREVLHKTLGVPLFQEQVMRLAVVAGGFSGGEADKLRRAMGAWRRKGVIEDFRRKLITGMRANGYDNEFAERLFDMIRGFGEYGFPESHSASFALLVYVSCWLKCYYPAEFAAALINSQPMGFYAPAQIVRDARAHGCTVHPVDVSHSNWDCDIEHAPAADTDADAAPGTIRLGMRLVKGLPQQHAEAISAARRAHAFADIDDVAQRTGIGSPGIKRLARADAFGGLKLNRRAALWHALALETEENEMPLFAAMRPAEPQVTLPEMPLGREVLYDYSMVGLSLKCHPVSLVRDALERDRVLDTKRLEAMSNGQRLEIAGLVICRQRPETARGIIFMTIEDEHGAANIVVKPELFDRFRVEILHARLICVGGYVQRDNEVIHVIAQKLTNRTDLLPQLTVQARNFH